MSTKARLALVLALAIATFLPTSAASASTVPNLVAVASPDRLVALTFAAYPTPRTLADAGAFATHSIRDYGLIGIPNYEPTEWSGSELICWSVSEDNTELVAVYGISAQGWSEATRVCAAMNETGYVHWRRLPETTADYDFN